MSTWRPWNLDMFFETYSPDQVAVIPTLISVEGGDPSAAGVVDEASLDIELMMGLLGPGENLSLYQVAQTNTSLDPTDRLLAALDESYCSVDCGIGERPSRARQRHLRLRADLCVLIAAVNGARLAGKGQARGPSGSSSRALLDLIRGRVHGGQQSRLLDGWLPRCAGVGSGQCRISCTPR